MERRDHQCALSIDYTKHGADDRLFTGERTRNENWHGYGQKVLAVADGRVAAIQDGLAGNTGASAAPHLHFQLSEAPDVTSDGVPYAHASFDVVARCRQTGPTF